MEHAVNCPHCSAAASPVILSTAAAEITDVSTDTAITAMQVLAVGPYLPMNRQDLAGYMRPVYICLDDLRGPAGGYWEVRPSISAEPFTPVYFGSIDVNGYFIIPPNVPVSHRTVPGSAFPVKGAHYIALNPMTYPWMLAVCGQGQVLPEVPTA